MHGRRTEKSGSTAKPPKFDGTAAWRAFRRQFESLSEHNVWTRQEKFTYRITRFQGRATDVLHAIAKGETYEERLQALEDRLGEQNFAAGYRNQLKVRMQTFGESQ